MQRRRQRRGLFFRVAQIRTPNITGKECVAREQARGPAVLPHQEANAVRRMARGFEHDHFQLSDHQSFPLVRSGCILPSGSVRTGARSPARLEYPMSTFVQRAQQVLDRVQHRRGVRLDRHPVGAAQVSEVQRRHDARDRR